VTVLHDSETIAQGTSGARPLFTGLFDAIRHLNTEESFSIQLLRFRDLHTAVRVLPTQLGREPANIRSG